MEWYGVNKTIRGASHKRVDSVCQDYSLVFQPKNNSLPLIAVAADGHGSKRYPRSAVGSKLACETAQEISMMYCEKFFLSADFKINSVKDICNNSFKKDVIRSWTNKVLCHASNNKFSDDELLLLGISQNDDSISVMSKIIMAYGTTLMNIIILDDFILIWQIGDGDILFYFKDNRVLLPIQKDSRHFANETSSLCASTAFNDMYFNIQYLFNACDIPDLIMMSTDGYSNSFNSKEGFYKAPADFCFLIEKEGLEVVSDSLEGWLNETTEQGSGDDITLILLGARL